MSNVHSVYHNNIRRLLAKHHKIWSGELGTVNNTVSRIKLIKGARPVWQMPYRQGLAGRDFEEKEVQEMLKSTVGSRLTPSVT